jgi:hypothetical protein
MVRNMHGLPSASIFLAVRYFITQLCALIGQCDLLATVEQTHHDEIWVGLSSNRNGLLV